MHTPHPAMTNVRWTLTFESVFFTSVNGGGEVKIRSGVAVDSVLTFRHVSSLS
jgi:hypothetical protein